MAKEEDKDKVKHKLTGNTLRMRWVHKHKFVETGRAKTKDGEIATNKCSKCGKERAWIIKPNGKVSKLDYAETEAKIKKAKEK